MEMNFVWNNVRGELIVKYMTVKTFGQKANLNIKYHENQFCVELTISYMLAESFVQKVDSNLKPH
jgi:hypothetical protein